METKHLDKNLFEHRLNTYFLKTHCASILFFFFLHFHALIVIVIHYGRKLTIFIIDVGPSVSSK